MGQESLDEQCVSKARTHIDGLLTALCTEAFAHHNYWALHHIKKIADAQVQAQVLTEFETAMQGQLRSGVACTRDS